MQPYAVVVQPCTVIMQFCGAVMQLCVSIMQPCAAIQQPCAAVAQPCAPRVRHGIPTAKKKDVKKVTGFLQKQCICAFARPLQPALLEFSVAVYMHTVCQPQKKAQVSTDGGFVSGCKNRPVVKSVFWL